MKPNISIYDVLCVLRGTKCICETWTYSKAMDHKINAFERWCYRRMLLISWTSRTTHIDVLQKMYVKETTQYTYDKQPEKHKGVICGPHIVRNREDIRNHNHTGSDVWERMLGDEGDQQEEDCYHGDEDASRDPRSVENPKKG